MYLIRLILTATIVILISSCSKTGDNAESVENKMTGESSAQEAEWVLYPQINPSDLSGLQKGDEYSIVMNDTMKFDLRIKSRNEFIKGIESFSASILGKREGTATLSIQADTVVGNFQFPGEEWLYTLSYDRDQQRHIMKRVKPGNMEGDDVLYPDSTN